VVEVQRAPNQRANADRSSDGHPALHCLAIKPSYRGAAAMVRSRPVR
jgi:hypothetical protein